MNKENWISKVENSTEGISKLEPSDGVWTKIQSAISKTREVTFTGKQVFAIAASLLVLISLNISLLASTNTESADTEASLLKEQVEGNLQDNIYGEI